MDKVSAVLLAAVEAVGNRLQRNKSTESKVNNKILETWFVKNCSKI
jgi:hypothetical protein